MRRRRGNEIDEAEVNMTPMLDIVFIMLIFFIVTATFIRESGLDVSRPDDQEEEQQKAERAILIQIDEKNDIYVNRRIVDLRAVRANVERLRAENPKSPVVIQTARRARMGILVDVMDQARQAKAPVSLIPMEDEN